MKYIYHYHAIAQNQPGEITNIDGTLAFKIAVDWMGGYPEIKSIIAKNHGLDASKLCICSLSLLEASAE